MSKAPFSPDQGEEQSLRAEGHLKVDRSFIAHYEESPLVADIDGILTAVTDDGTEQTIVAFDGQPDVSRCITATAGGTATDIKAIQIEITGTDVEGNEISETLPAFTENTAGIVTGSKAFYTVTEVVIPAHDGNGATTAVGFGDKLGLSHKLSLNTVLKTFLNLTVEGTAPTVTVSATALESNTVDLNSALDGNNVDVFYLTE